MQIRDLDGNMIKWHPKETGSKDTRAKSGLHEKARELISAKYPTLQFLEEVQIPIRRNQYLYLDFYNSLTKTAYEVHGEQHYKFVPHFHNNAQGFIKHKKRDAEKELWCEQNGITLVVLACHELEQWKEQI